MFYSNALSLKRFFGRVFNRYYYFYFFVMVLFTARAVPVTGSMVYYTGNFISFIFPVLLTFILLLKYPVSFKNRNFNIVICIITFWFLAQYIKYGELNVSLTIYLYYGIIIAYIHIRVYGKNIIYLYEDVVAHLSAISLVGWVVQIIAPKLIHLLMIFPSNTGTISGSCLFYSEGRDYETAILFFRNAGFSWEPGMFASLVVIALFFNAFINHFKFKGNKKFYILLAALATSQSTTGYGALILLGCIIYLLNYRSQYKFIIAVVIVSISVAVYNLPIMGEKIKELWVNDVQETKERLYEVQGYYQETLALTRFESLAMETYNIRHDPILGYGRDNTNSYVEKELKLNVGLPNGLFKVIAKYGCILGLLFYLCLFISSQWMAREFKYKGTILFFIAYCMISVSYSFVESPIFIAFLFFPLFLKEKNIYAVKSNCIC